MTKEDYDDILADMIEEYGEEEAFSIALQMIKLIGLDNLVMDQSARYILFYRSGGEEAVEALCEAVFENGMEYFEQAAIPQIEEFTDDDYLVPTENTAKSVTDYRYYPGFEDIEKKVQ